jgi:glycosyltransferase involved in cell wall biosynthesis
MWGRNNHEFLCRYGSAFGYKGQRLKIALIGTTAACVIGFRSDLIRLLVARNHSVLAFALDYTEETRASVRRLGAEPVDFRFSRTGLNPFADVINTYRLYRILRTTKPDLVLSYFSKPVIFGTLASLAAGVPKRFALLEGLGFLFTDQPGALPLKTRFLRAVQVSLYRLAFKFLEQVIFLNQDDPKDLFGREQWRGTKYSVLGGIGLDLADYPYSKPDTSSISFIFVGRFLAEKGINEYIDAAKIVKKRYPETAFYLLGALDKSNPGALTETGLEALINQDVVVYPGYVDDVVGWLEKASVFVLPSYREGVPRSTQEAMAIGRPVITTDVPGCRETVIDGKNGFLVPPWRPEMLAEKMLYFLENPEDVAKMGAESRRIAEREFDSIMVNNNLLEMLGVE